MIKWIVIALIGLIILGYLGFDVRRAIEAPTTQTNIEYVKSAIVFIWNKYLSKPASYLWNDVFIKYIWNPAIGKLIKSNLESNKNTESLATSTPLIN